ncbi:hypothetical protein PILCRDRAFT_3607 [Piloderma croceum F 1598]|uniref:Uncharacterized protein n=1 Tax=Piloderma croceum (strain F 1598) TaxID=765440 RepID=A0A0C3GB75_PILCF|nr:hypothetical protein PILCRDRAFT_3607 [Piloderma croceum F 1598]
MACATLDAKTGGYSFPKKLANEVTVNKANAKTIVDIIADAGSSVGSLYDIYKPYVAPLISTVTDKVLKPLASAREATSFYFYAYGLDVSTAI